METWEMDTIFERRNRAADKNVLTYGHRNPKFTGVRHIETETRFARIFRNASFARNDVVQNKNKINCFFVYEIKYKQLLAKADYGPVESKRGGRGGPLVGFI